MASEGSFFQNGDAQSIWQRYCGFLDLSIEGFMEIQEHLLKEQVNLVARSALGKRLLKGKRPATVEEFRQLVPLTGYKDYVPYLNDGREDSLVDTQAFWIHTSAPSGSFKRVPWAQRFYRVQARNIMAALVLASAREREEVRVAPGFKVLTILPEKPFASACLAYGLAEEFPMQMVPPLGTSQKMLFRHKIDEGLRLALRTDLDFVVSMTSSLLRIGERATTLLSARPLPLAVTKLHPKVLGRLLRTLLGGRRPRAPRDLWSPKGVIGWGVDSGFFTKRVEEQWGRPLYQLYASSESGIMAMQELPHAPMAFVPDSVFLEFLPEEEMEAGREARTVLLGQVEDGKLYEPVITNFYGMPFLRYRQGDLIRIHRASGSATPRMVFHGRADDVIDLSGIARLNTGTVLRALELAHADHGDWCLRKEYEGDRAILRLYIELGNGTKPAELGHNFHKGLGVADQHYREAVLTTAFNPVRVTALPKGTFQRLARQDGRAGNRVRMNPPDSVIQELIQLAEQKP